MSKIKTNVSDHNYSLGGSVRGIIFSIRDIEHVSRGTVRTPHGIVEVWIDNRGSSEGRASNLQLNMCKDGRSYSRIVERTKAFTKRGAAIHAGRFSDEIALA